MPPVKKIVPYEPRSLTMSGRTYDLMKKAKVKVKVKSKRKIGAFGGLQYTYIVSSKEEQVILENAMAEAALDESDAHGDNSPAMLQVYKDLGKLQG